MSTWLKQPMRGALGCVSFQGTTRKSSLQQAAQDLGVVHSPHSPRARHSCVLAAMPDAMRAATSCARGTVCGHSPVPALSAEPSRTCSCITSSGHSVLCNRAYDLSAQLQPALNGLTARAQIMQRACVGQRCCSTPCKEV